MSITEKVSTSINRDSISKQTLISGQILDRCLFHTSGDYITIPLTVNYHFGTRRNWYVNYRIAVGFLINAEANYNDGNRLVELNNLAKSTQFGINEGIRYKFKISPDFSIITKNSNLIGLTDTTEQKSGKNFYMSFNIDAVFKI